MTFYFSKGFLALRHAIRILNNRPKNTLSGGNLFISRLIDFSLLGVLAIYILSYLSSNNYELKSEDIDEMYQNTIQYLDNNSSIITTTLIVLTFYMVTYIFGVPMTSDMKPISIRIIEIVLIAVMTLVLFVFFFKNVLNISIVDNSGPSVLGAVNATTSHVIAILPD